MIWGDILCERLLNEDEIRCGVAEAFAIDSVEVAVVPSIEHLPKQLPFVILRQVSGDFACCAEVFLADEHPGPRVDALVRFARSVSCRVLTDTELNVDFDPFDLTLAEPSGRARRVTMDLDDEEDDVYRLR